MKKRGFPGSFLLFLLVALLIFLAFHHLTEDQGGKVSFSHQVEHLVNLDLIKKEESRKIALNDNLVSFSGKFRDRLTEEAQNRFRYLELLSKNHQFVDEGKNLEQDLSLLRRHAKEAADWFLHLSGLPVPEGGYRVVGNIYDTPSEENAIVITKLSPKKILSLPDIREKFTALYPNPTAASLEEFNKDLLTLIQEFRSPALGIGSEAMKQQLKTLQEQVVQASQIGRQQQLALYQEALVSLGNLTSEIDREESGGVRLIQLRSVRNYKADLEQSHLLTEELEKNTAQLNKARSLVAGVVWYFNNQELSTRALEKQDPEVFNQWVAQAKQEWDNFNYNKGSSFKAPDQPRNVVLERTFKSEEPAPNYFSYFLTLLPVILVAFLLYFVFSRQMKGGMGAGAMTFGKSPARLMTKEQNKTTFKDVAGCDEAKEELKEVVDFLKDPSKFKALGARIPKGVLLFGAPGTGKTLIAKAVAGEADRPFFSISGSDFVEMFVGVGASRIRDMFDQAKKHAPCIIFMDEIDAVGRHRGSGIGGGHDEREQTLNQLLVEMDGFDTSEGVILIAATNRPDVLDKALLRPGRFDRRIVIDLPDVKGRYEILKVHARRIKLDPSVDLMKIARNTPGASGADLENILNEAALMAARTGRSAVTVAETNEACDKVRFGKERRSLELDETEKRTTAIHESGHAMVALHVEHADPVDKVTIIPRGFALGATHFMPKKNRVNYWKKEILDQLAVLMGGRVAEEIFAADISSGAQMDFSQATKLARSMICQWGMNDALGQVSYDDQLENGFSGFGSHPEKKYSEETARQIDEEVRKLLNEAHQRAHEIILSHRDQVQLMADMLMEFETLYKEDVEEIIAGKWDSEKKKERIKALDEKYRKRPPPPPPELVKKEDLSSLSTTDDPSPQPT